MWSRIGPLQPVHLVVGGGGLGGDVGFDAAGGYQTPKSSLPEPPALLEETVAACVVIRSAASRVPCWVTNDVGAVASILFPAELEDRSVRQEDSADCGQDVMLGEPAAQRVSVILLQRHPRRHFILFLRAPLSDMRQPVGLKQISVLETPSPLYYSVGMAPVLSPVEYGW